MKAQLLSPVHTVIFSLIIISVLLVFNAVIIDWKDYALLKNEINGFFTKLYLLSGFSDCNYEYETSTPLNITINNVVNFTSGENSIIFDNNFGLSNYSAENTGSIAIIRINGVWIIQ